MMYERNHTGCKAKHTVGMLAKSSGIPRCNSDKAFLFQKPLFSDSKTNVFVDYSVNV